MSGDADVTSFKDNGEAAFRFYELDLGDPSLEKDTTVPACDERGNVGEYTGQP
jgi:hypothetical protein